MAARSTNTFGEWVQKTMADLGQAKTLPDVTPDEMTLLVSVENLFLSYVHKPIDANAASGAYGPGGGQDPNAQPQPAPDGQGGAPSGQGTGGVPGVAMQAPAPNPDELRRVLQFRAGQ